VSERDNVLPITTGRVRAARDGARASDKTRCKKPCLVLQELEPIEPNIRDYLRVIFD
jgi:hypothetical protein